MERFFHAPGRGAYFEGWYFKLQTRGGEALALIPALHQDAALRRSASLQVITREGSWWLEYPEAEFGASAERLRIRAGANIFTEKGLRVSADAPGLRLRGAVGFGAFTRLVSDIMGPFRFLPGMECSHGVISMTHSLEGALSINGRTLDFTGGTGYIETDRGRSFPRAYLWAQCAWGGHSGFMLSAATIPLPLGGFTGCICALVHGGARVPPRHLPRRAGGALVRRRGGGEPGPLAADRAAARLQRPAIARARARQHGPHRARERRHAAAPAPHARRGDRRRAHGRVRGL